MWAAILRPRQKEEDFRGDGRKPFSEDLLSEIQQLRDEVAQMRRDMDILMAGMAEVKAEIPEYHQQIHETLSLRCQTIARRMDSMEDILALPEIPKPRQSDQRDVLRALLAQNSNGKWIPAKAIRQKMNMGKDEFSRLLKISKDFVEVKENPRDRREKLLKIS
ncbi:MAG: hypothetical protein A4E48_00257 [Methanosaeta sp. PtaU1.Bin060]|nr:MAG: hypothetical protein A4E48_00257 [Methanosaeta sp. PtaU1.Bin060]